MTETVDYYFSVVSPWAYMGHERLCALLAQHGLQARYHPLCSPDLFPATGGALPKDRAPQRMANRMTELKRWRDHLGAELNPTPKHFPVPEAPASKLLLATQDAGGDAGALLYAFLHAVWAEEKDVSDPGTLAQLADGCGLDGAALMAAASDPKYDDAFAAETQAAIARNVFGYPTYIYKDELFWGQDRLDFLARAMEAG